MSRWQASIAIALLSSLWCWLLVALHGLWSFGIVRGYLDQGFLPMSPSIPVTYWSFFMQSISVPLLCFILTAPSLLVLRPLAGLLLCLLFWLICAYLGASIISFAFQIDFGATWGPGEAVLGLFYHPVASPALVLIGLAGVIAIHRYFST